MRRTCPDLSAALHLELLLLLQLLQQSPLQFLLLLLPQFFTAVTTVCSEMILHKKYLAGFISSDLFDGDFVRPVRES